MIRVNFLFDHILMYLYVCGIGPGTVCVFVRGEWTQTVGEIIYMYTYKTVFPLKELITIMENLKQSEKKQAHKQKLNCVVQTPSGVGVQRGKKWMWAGVLPENFLQGELKNVLNIVAKDWRYSYNISLIFLKVFLRCSTFFFSFFPIDWFLETYKNSLRRKHLSSRTI